METAKERALSVFRQPPHRLNCAQSVAYGLSREDLLEALANNGVGKAPEGMCGAAYALSLLAGTEKAESALEAFKSRNGSVYCQELKRVHKVPCTQCVATAVDICESLK
ncbi:MAG: C-GCAxxG-C-C family protein [Opitutales bacterium]|nr:C-GCAxxG-C-C family protein [Opitutales bacterium]